MINPFESHYDQLIVGRNVIPYKDLLIAGDYQRHLIIPDDMFPILSVPSAQQGTTPRLVTMDNDGGVNVHVVNSSGGGGTAIAAYTPTFKFNSPIGLNLNGGSVQVDLSLANIHTLYMGTFGVASQDLTAGGPIDVVVVQFSLQGNTAPFRIDLCGFSIGMNDGTGKIKAVTKEQTVVFCPPIDIADSVGDAGLTMVIDEGVNGNAIPWFTLTGT